MSEENRRMKGRARRALPVVAILLTMAATPARAAGPAAVATVDRKLWPESLDSRGAFDRASRAEILVFTHELALQEGEPSRRSEGARRWLDQMHALLVENFRRARTTCTSAAELGCDGKEAASFASLAERARAFVASAPAALVRWLPAARDFHRAYLAEQLRLATLFGKTTSEILTFDRGERNGSELPDLDFLLSFDDGPTAAGGDTDATLKALRTLGATGIFFALGKNLAARRERDGERELRALYAGQCLASHGASHGSHAKMASWRASIETTRDSIRGILGQAATTPVPFRPPYGQRTKEIATWAKAAGSPIVLWNIDSQDWNPKMADAAVADRMLTLMALWRRGILLFHDTHAKAAHALPQLVRTARGSGIEFLDCHAFEKEPPP
jgi:peptidoglycan/xylan/chitin deacetylase (PgdA/CDA1 family)